MVSGWFRRWGTPQGFCLTNFHQNPTKVRPKRGKRGNLHPSLPSKGTIRGSNKTLFLFFKKVLLLPLIVTLEAYFRRILMQNCQPESFGCSPPSRPPRNHQELPGNIKKPKNKVLLVPLIVPLEGREGKPPVQTFQEDPSLDKRGRRR